MAEKNRSGGFREKEQYGPKGIARGSEKATTDEFVRASDIHGKNSLQGDDQANNVNQRRAQADASGKTDDVRSSFEKVDKDVRAERDLGKGNRHGNRD